MPFFADNDRTALRNLYFEAWRKHRTGLPLEPLEAQIADVIAAHPEYHPQLEPGGDTLERDFSPEDGTSNPFLHMGLHLALRDQVATDRPRGIRRVFERLLAGRGSSHDAEHVLLECLAETLWEAQRNGATADEQRYLECVERRSRA
jgi:hypothetical protein